MASCHVPTVQRTMGSTMGDSVAVLYPPIYRLCHPEIYVLLLSKNTFIGSKCPPKNFFFFEENFTDGRYRAGRRQNLPTGRWPFWRVGPVSRCEATRRNAGLLSGAKHTLRDKQANMKYTLDAHTTCGRVRFFRRYRQLVYSVA